MSCLCPVMARKAQGRFCPFTHLIPYYFCLTCIQLPSLSQNSFLWCTFALTGTQIQTLDSRTARVKLQTPGCWRFSDCILQIQTQGIIGIIHDKPVSKQNFTIISGLGPEGEARGVLIGNYGKILRQHWFGGIIPILTYNTIFNNCQVNTVLRLFTLPLFWFFVCREFYTCS